MKITFPQLTSYQEEVWQWLGEDYLKTGKIAVIKALRQVGKSLLCCLILINTAVRYKRTTSVVIEPTLEQSRNMYNTILKAMQPTRLITQANAQTLSITFVNGSVILFKSTAQNDGNRGYTADLLILDEAAYLDDEAIYTILPLASARNAPIIITSTPFIRDGYFYDMYSIGESGENPNIKSFDWSKSKDIGKFLTEDKKALYKQTMSRTKYITEVLGEFLSDEGLLFTNLDNCTLIPEKIENAYIGIDFGTGSDNDYTAISIMNEDGHQWGIYRTNNLSPMQQVDWLTGHINFLKDKNIKILRIYAEKNSIGSVYIDSLESRLPDDVRITDWVTSNASKQDLVTTFQIALENETVGILPDNSLHNELRAYTQTINPKTKSITYGNGKGCKNDDQVIATMLSYKAYKDGGRPMYSLGRYKSKVKRH